MARALHVYRSNRVEALADAAADLFALPSEGAGPLDAEPIVVQGRGMAVWLSMELSRRHGIWAGASFLYPRNFVQELFERVLGQGIAERYDRDQLMWSVLALLGEHASHPELAPLSGYLARDETGARSYQLARRIADTFDQYLIYRPDWVRAWEAGGDDGVETDAQRWQPQLWRMLHERLGHAHAAGLERALLDALGGDAPIPGLPKRLAVFGIASLPPMYARILAALARRVEVHWFLPSPAVGYWADFATPERVARAGTEAEALHLDSGHPLLASLGRLGAELQVVLSAELEALGVSDDEPAGELFVDPPDDTLLGRLQADILDARAEAHGAIAPGDSSIALFACHSPMREVEVLHDQLLELIAVGGVAPHEIVVMMPDVEAYAPLIEAVFEREAHDPRFIPYRVADRHLRRDSPVVDAFLRVLELAGSRAPVSAVLDLLALAPVAGRFGIAPEEIDTLRRWIAESGIRWGIDAEHRARHGQPAVPANTWRFGLTRLLLGYAMPSEGRALFAGALAYDEIEGKDAVLLGKLATFCESLFDVMEQLEVARPVSEQATTLGLALDAMIAVDPDSAWEHRLLRRALSEAAESALEVGFDEKVGIDVLRMLLEEMVEQSEPARGFLAGGVTFCAMIPMRNIPFRVVGLMGLSDQAFPRTRRPVDFDLMAKSGARRAGDRSRRDDDRYLFLEALLAARERVLIVYTGQSIRDGSELAPSVVVSELLDALGAAHPGEDVAARLITRHPLQPFNRRYFDHSDERLFSYASEHCVAAQELLAGRPAEAVALFDGPLPPPEDDGEGAVALSELLRFFDGPVRYLLNRRLGVDLSEREQALADREPVELDPLEQWAIGDQLLTLRVDGVTADETQALVRASGILPLGTPGALDHEAVLEVVEPIAEQVRALREGGRRPDLVVSSRLPGGVLLSGEVGERWALGQLRHQFARVSGKQLLGLWIRHLVMGWRGDGESASYLVGRASGGTRRPTVAYRLRAVSDAAPLLESLARLYFRGLREPLPFFPKAGLAYAQAIYDGKPEQQALQRARNTYVKHERAHDPHLERVFGADEVILEGGFAALAREVMLPLVSELEVVG